MFYDRYVIMCTSIFYCTVYTGIVLLDSKTVFGSVFLYFLFWHTCKLNCIVNTMSMFNLIAYEYYELNCFKVKEWNTLHSM